MNTYKQKGHLKYHFSGTSACILNDKLLDAWKFLQAYYAFIIELTSRCFTIHKLGVIYMQYR